MSNLKLLFTFLFAVIIGIGINTTYKEFQKNKNNFNSKLEEYKTNLEKHRIDSALQIRSISAPQNAISYKVSSAAEAYQSAAQGIDVQLKGLSWRGFYIDQSQEVMQTLARNFDAYYTGTVDKIVFDPDFPDSGYPDLIIDIKNSPSFYRPDVFSEYLANIGLADPKPYKSIELNSCDKRKAIMNLWLVSFDITFRIEPNFEHNRNEEIKFSGKHAITRNTDDWIRRKREYNDMRYDLMAVFLEFNPKNFYYINPESNSESIVQPLNESPKIGIGAVECIMIQKIGENGINNSATRLGVDIEKGKSLSLYPDLEELKKIYCYKNGKTEPVSNMGLKPVKEMVSAYENLVDICDSERILADSNFFNQSKFSVIDLKNLGSWKQEKSWMLGPSEFKADYFHVKFLVHLYVLGEWLVKDENISKFEARPPAAIKRPGVLDYLFPDFTMGFRGKILSGILLPIILILVLSFVFPPIRIIVNQLLKKLIANEKTK